MGEVYKKFTTQKYEAIYQVEESQDGLRLDQYLAAYFPTFSRQNIKKKIKSGNIRIENRPYPHKASVKVYERERVQVVTHREDLEDEYWRGEKLDLQFSPDIIHEDEGLLAIGKPAYMATHPTGKHLFNCATVYLGEKYEQTIHSIHRLDRETSGILLLAKNPRTAQKCTSQFEANNVKKCYFFIAHKNQENIFPLIAHERLGEEDDFIPKLFVHCYPQNSKQGKRAETKFVKLFDNGKYIMGLALPKTGRTHQIRAHAANIGLPLVGDKLYNGDPTVFMRFKDGNATKEDHDLMQLSRHALHATAIKIPYKNDISIFKAPLLQDFQDWIKENISEANLDNFQKEIMIAIDKELAET